MFALADSARGELVRYDAARNEVVPYLDGIFATWVRVSPDGQSLAYTTYPDVLLWRSRLDGTGKMRLTNPPFLSYIPRWSADGNRIYVVSGLQTYVVPATGGKPVQAIPGSSAHLDPNLSPDGKVMAFSDG